MRKMMIAGLIILQACTSSGNYVRERFAETTPDGISTAVAHRGCWLRENSGEYYIPENCPAGVAMAARYGYPAVECDVKYTKDSVMVIMHDGTINRTMRNAADYSKIQEPVRVSETTFAELREKMLKKHLPFSITKFGGKINSQHVHFSAILGGSFYKNHCFQKVSIRSS